MKRYIPIMAIVLVPMLAVPGHCFLDYFFGGSSTSDAIGNNVVGDLRAWWTGNPVYNFNPYYSGSNPLGQQPNQATQGGQTMNPMASPQGGAPQYYPQQNQQPSVTYYPPQGQQQYYGQGQPMQQQQQQYPQQMPPQAYQQQAPQQGYYQQGPQQYPPQAYEQQAPQYYQGGQPGGGRFQNYQYEHDTPQPD